MQDALLDKTIQKSLILLIRKAGRNFSNFNCSAVLYLILPVKSPGTRLIRNGLNSSEEAPDPGSQDRDLLSIKGREAGIDEIERMPIQDFCCKSYGNAR